MRLISPFMPFISEELFQRLPRRSSNEPPSICVTPYPKASDYSFRNEELEKQFEFVQHIVHNVRSRRSEYNLPNKSKTDLYLKCTEAGLCKTLSAFDETLKTLSYSNQVFYVVDEPIPDGCAIFPVSDKCEVHLLLKGLIDPVKEVAKLDQKQERLKAQLGKLQDATQMVDYDTKVPEDVKKLNAEKLVQLDGELQKVIDAIASLKTF